MRWKQRAITSLVNSHDDGRTGIILRAGFEQEIGAANLSGGKEGEQIGSCEKAARCQSQPTAYE
jgi:hypothetical protein